MKKLASLTLSLFLMTGTAFADTPKDTPKNADVPAAKAAAAAKAPAVKSNAEIAAEMEELRQALQSQQEELQLLKEELAKRDKQIEDARETAASANSRASEANVKATEAVNTSAEAKSTTSTLNTTVANIAATNAATNAAVVNGNSLAAGGQNPDVGPASIRFKGITLTPGGFIEAATVNRQRAISGDINTQFSSIPYPGNSLAHISEMNFSARQSRFSLLAESQIGSAKVQGYFEGDFLGAGTTSNNRESNSYVFRMRQGFGRVEFADGFSFSAGQMWSLASENKKGIVNRGENLPQQIDPQYVVGWIWQRAYSARVVKNFGDKLALAVAIEGPQTTIGGRGFNTYTSTTATGVVTTFQNFWFNAPGSSGSLYNAFDPTGYTANKLPDFIVKAALDPGWGHYEVFGIISEFRNRIYPCSVVGTTAGNFPTPATPVTVGCSATASLVPSADGAYNDSRNGGGFGVSGFAPLIAKKLDIGLKATYGSGIGRFGSAQLADVTAHNDGSLATLKNAMWLGRLEFHPTPKFDIYGYVGGEYAGRAGYTGYTTIKVTSTPAVPGCGAVGQQACAGGGIQPSYPALTTTSIATNGIGGYGSPYANNSGCSTEVSPAGTGTPGAGGTCAGDIRYIGEGTLGFWHRIYSGEKGRVQWGVQYSYLYKTGWSGSNGLTGTTSVSPHAVDNMVLTSFRYYLP
jgi:hypothetical protein